MDYMRFLNSYGQKLRPPVIRSAMKQMEGPGMTDVLSVAPGLPNPETFPITDMTFKLRDGTVITFSESEIEAAQQYGSTQGMPILREILEELQKSDHNPPTYDYTDERQMKICLTPGSQNSIYMAIKLFHSENDYVLTEEANFFCAGCPSLTITGLNALEIKMDSEGMDPQHLQQTLSKWDNDEDRSKSPRVLWVCPTCNNPLGVSYSLERKKQIYALAQKYDLLIIEDGAYFYLQDQKPRIPSFLSLDVDGRVVRFDTFSKVIAPGLRIGFITGPRAIVDVMEFMLMESVQHTSTLSQMITYKMLKQWGIEGFHTRAYKLAEFYKRRRDVALQALNKYMKGLAEWNIPAAGALFVWLTIPNIGADAASFVERLVKTKRIFVTPGWAFSAKAPETLHVRISVGTPPDDIMDECLKRLADFIREEKDRLK